tara:strand:+ start:1369 stop:1926 length:558 start_codon:yes stop_codon:yes gene_type:complete
MRLQEILALGGLIIVLLLATTVKADIIYDYTANLLEDNIVTIEQQTHYYDIFYISALGEATVTFNNYNANLSSNNSNYDYNDPYLYLYIAEQKTFNGLEQFTASYILDEEDDDGNYEVDEGLYFYLPNYTFNNELVAMVTSYDPEVTGTVDFTITSDKPLTVIPEPQALGLILLTGAGLLLGRKR